MYAQLDFTQNRFKMVNLVGGEEIGIMLDLTERYPDQFVNLDGREDLPSEMVNYYDSELDRFVMQKEVIYPEPEPTPIPQPTNQELQDFQLTMMTAMADQYEQNLANQLTTMEVQATIYESILQLGGTTV